MMYLEHNLDTSLNMFIKVLNDKFKEGFSYRDWLNHPNIENGKFVKIVDSSLKNDLLSLIEKLKSSNGDYLPTILVAQSKEIDQTKYLSQLNFSKTDTLELKKRNGEDKIHLEGVSFDFETRVQFVILTRNNTINREVALELLRILTECKSINYPLKIVDSESPSDEYIVEDFGRIDVMGFENNPPITEEIGDDDMLVVATTLEASLREQYFRFKEAEVYKRAKIEPTIAKHKEEDTSIDG